jgi:hypothetical protein
MCLELVHYIHYCQYFIHISCPGFSCFASYPLPISCYNYPPIHTHFNNKKKRIQAAQERARLAEQKEREAKKAAEEERRAREKEIEDEIVRKATESQAEQERKRHEKEMKDEAERIQKAQMALRSVAERALEDKHKQQDDVIQLQMPPEEEEGGEEVVIGDGSSSPIVPAATIPSSIDATTHSIATVGVVEQPTVAVPIMKSLDPPPPPPSSYLNSTKIPLGTISEEMVGHGMNSRVLSEQQQQHYPETQPAIRAMKPDPPPSFNIDHEQQSRFASVQSTKPVVPPPAAAFHRLQPIDPPTFADDEGIDSITEYDESGNHLTPQQRHALLDEQRKLYESIMKEKADNDAAIAKANADLFDMRSSSAVARSMTGDASIAGRNIRADSTATTISPGGDADSSMTADSAAAAAAPSQSSSQRMITIGSNQTVALHGQDITQKAISDGTAILIQCVNCQNWMQVTGKATLMLCPICRVVSPVVKQNEVLTRDEAIQLTKDRELAEKLQAELNHGEGGVSEAGNIELSSSQQQQQSDSWWNRLSSIVSYGVADEVHPRGELGVTRPPGSAAVAASLQYPAQRRGNTSSSGVILSSNIHSSAETSDDMVGHGMNSRFLSEQQQQQRRTTITPSAPPHATTELLDHLHGVQPVAPPSSTNVQSDAQQASSTVNDDDDIDLISEFDENGNPLTLEQRRTLLNEQRKLYESIMKEKADNDAAIAEANAESFDRRSSSAASSVGTGRYAAETSDTPQAKISAGASADQEGAMTSSSQRRIKIGSNQTVALRGQESTKKAIKDGTAIIVQCINCQHWMQITGSATLMLCPICQVVSPVVKQNEVLTKEDAIQLTIDRKLAEKLQSEINNGEVPRAKTEEGYFTRFFGGSISENSASAAATQQKSDSWWNRISSIVSYGEDDEAHHHRGELGVTRPPGSNVATASQYPAQLRGSNSSVGRASISGTNHTSTNSEETRGLLGPVVIDGNEENLPPGRVAERQPLFSCVVNSVSSAAAAVFTNGDTDSEGNVHGVDGRALLITNAGRGVGDNAGDYSRLSDEDRFD